MNGASGRD